jgi:peptide deformylase
VILKVTRLGHPVLRQKAKAVPVSEITSSSIQAFIQDMAETMEEYDGVGIAAPQVHVSLQIAVIGIARKNVRYPKAPKIPLTVLINPKVKAAGKDKLNDWEGCLSVDGLRGEVPRWKSVEVMAYNTEGQKIQFKAHHFFARVIQHEYDHLQGKVYLDRMSNLSTLSHLTEHARYWT